MVRLAAVEVRKLNDDGLQFFNSCSDEVLCPDDFLEGRAVYARTVDEGLDGDGGRERPHRRVICSGAQMIDAGEERTEYVEEGFVVPDTFLRHLGVADRPCRFLGRLRVVFDV